MRGLTIRLSASQAAFGFLSGAYLPFFSPSLASPGIPPSHLVLFPPHAPPPIVPRTARPDNYS